MWSLLAVKLGCLVALGLLPLLCGLLPAALCRPGACLAGLGAPPPSLS